jgi:hypothetical protein
MSSSAPASGQKARSGGDHAECKTCESGHKCGEGLKQKSEIERNGKTHGGVPFCRELILGEVPPLTVSRAASTTASLGAAIKDGLTGECLSAIDIFVSRIGPRAAVLSTGDQVTMGPEDALRLDTPRVMQRLSDPCEEALSLRLLALRFLAGNHDGDGSRCGHGICGGELTKQMARSNGTAKLIAVLLM